MVYKTGETISNQMSKSFNVVPNVLYRVKIEVLLCDLGNPSEKIRSIVFEGNETTHILGECNPSDYGKTDDEECAFWECPLNSSALPMSVTAQGSATVTFNVVGHRYVCDCNLTSWACGRAGNVFGGTQINFAARIALLSMLLVLEDLTEVWYHYIGFKTSFLFFYTKYMHHLTLFSLLPPPSLPLPRRSSP